MVNQSDTAVLIGFIVTIVIVGLAGGVTLTVFICLKWREYQKRRTMAQGQHHRHHRSRRRSRQSRRRATQVQPGPAVVELPPAYADVAYDPPPPYTPLGVLQSTVQREGNTRGSIRSVLTPIPQGQSTLARNSTFSHVHAHTGTTNTPMVTPAGSMFRSGAPTREASASSHARSINMVHFQNENQHASQALNLALNIHMDNRASSRNAAETIQENG